MKTTTRFVTKVSIKASNDLYLPRLREHAQNGKVRYALKTTTGMWSSVQIEKAVLLGYKVLDIYEQHRFPQASTTLFNEYNKTILKSRDRPKWTATRGLEAIA